MTARTPSVLVVVPTLGERIETLEESLASVRAQEGVDAHLVVVVPDGAVEARDIAVKHGATLVSDPRRGLSAAVNAGIAARRGEEFYAWLGDDDLLVPGGLATAGRLLDADPSAVVAYGSLHLHRRPGPHGDRQPGRRPGGEILAWGPRPGAPTRLADPDRAPGRRRRVRRVAALRDGPRHVPAAQAPGRFVSTKQDVAAFRWHADSLTVANRGMSLAESEKVKRRYLRAGVRPFSPLWDVPVRFATRRRRAAGQRAGAQGRGGVARLSLVGVRRAGSAASPRGATRSPAAAARPPRPACGSAPRAGPARSSGGC